MKPLFEVLDEIDRRIKEELGERPPSITKTEVRKMLDKKVHPVTIKKIYIKQTKAVMEWDRKVAQIHDEEMEKL